MRVMQERRSEVRMLCADMVDVCWSGAGSKARHGVALLEDISPSGACLQMENPIPLGSRIHWESKQRLAGYVRYCVYREIGYFIGVEFDPGVRWSKTSYRPQHLLDLERLMAAAKK